ncbi:MAG TPA: LPS assembly lipoprotein LptE [Gemmataceae bacterium]|nr:LPS assembly lipoprotein LptE [Gemmataceae bacterium]
MTRFHRAWCLVFLAVLGALPGCESGGHFTFLGYTTRPPFDPTIRSVYVPIPGNASWMRNLEFDLMEAMVAELNTRAGAPRIVSDPARADTELVMLIKNTTKNVVIFNQLGETRNAELGIQIEVVWRDLRPGHVGDILSNKRRFDPSEKPLPGDLAPTPPPPIPYLVTPTATYIPELGGSNTTANVIASRRAAKQIVNMMEVWQR